MEAKLRKEASLIKEEERLKMELKLEAELERLNTKHRDEIALLNQKMAESSLKAGQGQDKLSFLTKKGTICEFDFKEGQVLFNHRSRGEENRNFVFWVSDKQFCAKKEEEEWKIVLKEGSEILDEKTLLGSEMGRDRFIKRGNNVYVSIYRSGSFYLVTVVNQTLRVKLLGETNYLVFSVLEVGDTVYAGTTGKAVFRFEEGRAEKLMELSHAVLDVKIEGNNLWAVDFSSLVVGLDLNSEIQFKRMNIGGDGSYFFSGESVVLCKAEELLLFDMNGCLKKVYNNPVQCALSVLENNSLFAVLVQADNILIWEHTTKTFKYYKTEELCAFY